MKNLIRALLPQKIINIFWHLPKAILANILYGFPSRSLTVIGVTGTDGKTTTTNMVYQILKDANRKVSMVSTINAVVGGKSYDTGFHVTSPDPFMVQKFLKTALEKGDEYMILEVTSHALDQFRFWGIKFDIGVITNITHEHLDYHKTFENYKNTKLKLLNGVKWGIINQNLSQSIGRASNILLFGKDKKGLKLRIPGAYNLQNAQAALNVAKVLGIDEEIAKKTLENFKGLNGRMEEVKNKKGIKIIIDFAHTPNGLQNVLEALRSHLEGGKLISLIGCEGYRDEQKRPMMGEIAQKLSDVVIVTAVDPRGQIDVINKQISKGAIKAGAKEKVNFFEINNREEAISFALKLAKKGDTIGIFGKGHETSINLDGKKEIPWSDRKAVIKTLNE